MRVPVFPVLLVTIVIGAAAPMAQSPAAPAVQPPAARAVPAVAAPPTPPDYVVGPEDVLSIVFWRDKDMSADVVVRPDGKISLPVLNDIAVAGLSPQQVQQRILEVASRYFEDPAPTVVVKEIHSRKVFITGQVQKPGPYPLTGPLTVVQLIAVAGGLQDFAKADRILIVRSRVLAYKFNYEQFSKRKSLRQNLDLQPGDTVIVP
jgi:polysaccharide export outer membrane protein